MSAKQNNVEEAIKLLDMHYDQFYQLVPISRATGHPVPMDTRGWSQILASVITGLSGLARKKGADLEDGSDVKAANTWEAIDTPRFNGVVKAGTKSSTSDSLASLDEMPYLFLVMWDQTVQKEARCRIWCVRTQKDSEFRKMCEAWYAARESGAISSSNFQLHPPRGLDSNSIRNTFGNLHYPLLFCAVRGESGYEANVYEPEVLNSGLCTTGDGSVPAEILISDTLDG
ncbi:MamI family restriction endonuclease [Sphingorhabdus sp.]|uniref:MamI family restriction endonuclease n=1 Tax=Sphingorhabdus sp. TaxID=1902408 RepID=UPI003D818C9D